MTLVQRGGVGGRAAGRVSRPRFMASRRRRSSAGLGEPAALIEAGGLDMAPRPPDARAAPAEPWRPSIWGMGGPSEPSPERVTAAGEPCAWPRDTARRPGPGVTAFHESH